MGPEDVFKVFWEPSIDQEMSMIALSSSEQAGKTHCIGDDLTLSVSKATPVLCNISTDTFDLGNI